MSKYFYNGVELPALPEYDKTTYPYAVIYTSSSHQEDEPLLIVCTYTADYQPVYAFVGSSINGYALYANSDGTNLAYRLSSDKSEWVLDERYVNGQPIEQFESVYVVGESRDKPNFLKWANYDVYYTENSKNGELAGTLYLAASEPVPVDGVPTLTARDLYRKINGKPTKLTLYKKVGGKLIPLDEYTKEVKS